MGTTPPVIVIGDWSPAAAGNPLVVVGPDAPAARDSNDGPTTHAIHVDSAKQPTAAQQVCGQRYGGPDPAALAARSPKLTCPLCDGAFVGFVEAVQPDPVARLATVPGTVDLTRYRLRCGCELPTVIVSSLTAELESRRQGRAPEAPTYAQVGDRIRRLEAVLARMGGVALPANAAWRQATTDELLVLRAFEARNAVRRVAATSRAEALPVLIDIVAATSTAAFAARLTDYHTELFERLVAGLGVPAAVIRGSVVAADEYPAGYPMPKKPVVPPPAPPLVPAPLLPVHTRRQRVIRLGPDDVKNS